MKEVRCQSDEGRAPVGQGRRVESGESGEGRCRCTHCSLLSQVAESDLRVRGGGGGSATMNIAAATTAISPVRVARVASSLGPD